MSTVTAPVPSPPKDDLVRAFTPDAVHLRAADDGGPPVMSGHFAVFNRWTEIDSWFEGHFMERFAPGAFRKTFKENRDGIRALFQHGYDPVVGDKPLGTIDELREDETGGYYEVPLLDAPYVREHVLPGLEAGLYGASFRFQIMREEFVEKPDPSDGNPHGLPERTVKEARVFEFGPVTFPAYADATAGVRSLTAERHMAQHDPKVLLRMIASASAAAVMRGESLEDEPQHSQTEPEPETATTPDARRSTRPTRDYLRNGKEKPAWQL